MPEGKAISKDARCAYALTCFGAQARAKGGTGETLKKSAES